jgi:soluble cytochrome b562
MGKSHGKKFDSVNTKGGAYVAGNATVTGNFVGRDLFNITLGLDNVNDISKATNTFVELISSRKEDDFVNTRIVGILTDLMVELRKTHSTIVKLISPFRRIQNNHKTFSRDFKAYYNDFRDFVDTNDFIDERTHCSKIQQIKEKLLKLKSPLYDTSEWQVLQSQLTYINNMDEDVIEYHYVPFVERLDDAMKSIYESVDNKKLSDAIAKKQALLAGLEPEYEKTKVMLSKMNNTINTLVVRL